jgi:hypothetical protein
MARGRYLDDAERYADFHSLRHTTGSLLAASGVHPKVAQSLMRHSDINLTMSKYTHTLTGQEAQAVNSLPDLSLTSAEAEKVAATGTDGESFRSALENLRRLALKSTPELTPKSTPTAFPGSDRLAAMGTTRGDDAAKPSNRKSMSEGQLGTDRHQLGPVDTGKKVMGRTGVEPATHGFSVRCSTS